MKVPKNTEIFLTFFDFYVFFAKKNLSHGCKIANISYYFLNVSHNFLLGLVF